MNKIALIEAFRDFFYYGTSDQLKKSYLTIHSIIGTSFSLEDADWEQEEFLFNRLFIGPMAPLSPAIASVYLDPEGKVQGRITAQVREFYGSIGLAMEEAGSRPEDSIEYELDACRYLLFLGGRVPEAIGAYEDFINEHMVLWVDKFTEKALANCENESPVTDVLRLLSGFIREESEVTIKS